MICLFEYPLLYIIQITPIRFILLISFFCELYLILLIWSDIMKANHLILKTEQIDEVDRFLESDNGVQTENNQFQSANIVIHEQQKHNQHNSNAMDQMKDEQNHNLIEKQPELEKANQISIQPKAQQMQEIVPYEGITTENSQTTNNSIFEGSPQGNQPLNMYFQNLRLNLGSFNSVKNEYIQPLHKKIKKQLNQNPHLLAQESISLKLKNKQEQKRKQEEQIMKSLEQKRLDTIRMLRQIQSEEVNLFHNRRKYNSMNHKKMEKSHPNQEETNKIRQILKAKKEHQHQLEIKKQHLLMKREQKELEQKKRRDQEKLLLQNKKRQQIELKLKQLQGKAQEREQKLKKSTLQPNVEYLYQKKEEEKRRLQKQKQKEKEKQLKEIMMKKKSYISEIQEHQKKYQERLESQKTQQKKSMKSSSVKSLSNYSKNKYSKLIEQEMFDLKAKQYQKIMKIKEHKSKEKIINYQKHIDQNFKPKINENTVFVPQVHRTLSTQSLSQQERIKRGLQYLQMAKEMKKSTTSISNESQGKSQRFIYKDYLQDIRRKNSFDPNEKEFHQLTNKKNNAFESVIRAKFLAEGLESKAKLQKDEKVYFSFKNKLQILEGLY